MASKSKLEKKLTKTIAKSLAKTLTKTAAKKPVKAVAKKPRKAIGKNLVKTDGAALIALRQQQKENQKVFWARYGVTQSGGSRYESGRDMPKPLRMLIALHRSGKVTDKDLADALK